MKCLGPPILIVLGKIDKGMKDVKKLLNPTEVLLVVDAMTGLEAAALVAPINVAIEITGAILTKRDGDSRGGAALSVKEVGVAVYTAGTDVKPADLTKVE